MRINKSYFKWVVATSLGLCVAFPTAMQVLRLIKHHQVSWVGDWVVEDAVVHGNVYLAQFFSLLVMGTILGASQSVVTRSYDVPVIPWILTTAAGFAALSAVIFPLLHIGVWGNIPGPVEPLVITLGGCSLAGVFQYMELRRNQTRAAKWLGVWVVSLILGIVPTAVIFMTLEGPLGISINWPAQVALSGLLIGGFGALFSGQTFLKTLSQRLAT